MKKCSITSLCQEEVSRLVIVSFLRNRKHFPRLYRVTVWKHEGKFGEN